MIPGLLLLLALPAGAELLVFDAGRDPKAGLIFSADGYHYAFLESAEGEDRWLVDGRVRAKGPAGTLVGPAELSADGRVLLHTIAVADAAGRPLGVAAAVNGKRAGAPFPELETPKLSARGANAAYAVKTPGGWAVVSQQGTGPAFPELPLFLGITEKETLYFVGYGGGTWLYRNHKPVKRVPYGLATANSTLTRTAGVWRSGKPEEMIYVEADGEKFGPYSNASLPVFSADGRHYAFLASGPDVSGNSFDLMVVDGALAPMKTCGSCTVSVDDAGRAFQDQIMAAVDDRAQIHMAYRDGKSLHPGGQPPKVCFAPGGKHFVYPMLAPQGLAVGLDGRIGETGAPLPLIPAPCVFDGSSEYHYWSASVKGRLLLVCGSADGPRAPKTRCEAVARSTGRPRVAAVDEPASAPQ